MQYVSKRFCQLTEEERFNCFNYFLSFKQMYDQYENEVVDWLKFSEIGFYAVTKNLEVFKFLLEKKLAKFSDLKRSDWCLENEELYVWLVHNEYATEKDLTKLIQKLLKQPKNWPKLFSNKVLKKHCFKHNLCSKNIFDLSKKSHFEQYIKTALNCFCSNDQESTFKFFDSIDRSAFLENVKSYQTKYPNKFELSSNTQFFRSFPLFNYVVKSKDTEFFNQYASVLKLIDSRRLLFDDRQVCKDILNNIELNAESCQILFDLDQLISFNAYNDSKKVYIEVIEQFSKYSFIFENELYDINKFLLQLDRLNAVSKLSSSVDNCKALFNFAFKLNDKTLSLLKMSVELLENSYRGANEDYQMLKMLLDMHSLLNKIESTTQTDELRKSLDDSKLSKLQQIVLNHLQDDFPSIQDLVQYINKIERKNLLNI